MILEIPDYDGIGVYKITHTVTGRIYIGSSVNCYERLKKHSKIPQNLKMSEDAEKGPFVAEIIKSFPDGCTNRELAAAEGYYCELYGAADGNNYNDNVHSRGFHNQRRGNIEDYVIPLNLPKGYKERITEVAKANGESVNAYIKRLIDADLGNQNAE